MLPNDLNAIDDRPLILIVDDLRSNQQVLANLLKDDYRLKAASSGARALEIARQHPELDLILLDVMMPEMDGYEVCKHLKSDTATQGIPIIFITSADDETSESYGLQLGAVDYITKPIKPAITRIRIQKNIELRLYQKKLRLYAKIIDNSKEAIVITDLKGDIIDVNPAFTQITGYMRDEVLGQNPHVLNSVHQDPDVYSALWEGLGHNGHWSGELWNRKKNGEFYPEWISILAIPNECNTIAHYVMIASDITELKAREKQLEHIAHYDILTGIPNRVLLADRMKQGISQTRRDQRLMGICYLDLDGFKPVNDTLGHQAGDQVLIEIARRISRTIREGDTVARLGGDEFAILLMGLSRNEECIASIERILEAIRKPIMIQENTFILGASLGVTLFPLDDEDPDTLLRHADHAMYAAKQFGKNCYHQYSPERDSDIRRHHEFIKRIQQGLKQNEFELYYQPKLELRTRKMVGVEALIRWHHPQRGLLYPMDFLPLIEFSDLIVELGDWVITNALAQLNRWYEAGYVFQVSVNVAGRQIQHQDFITKLGAALAHYPHLPHSLLELEILETSALEIIQSAQIMQDACTQLGVSFALDDFGTGYCSLTYLKTLPINTLKIDQTFVCDMLTDAGDHAIVQSIISMADTFNRKTVAEGVETQKHFEALLVMGCDIGQGYGIAKPMPVSELMIWLVEHPSVMIDEQAVLILTE